MPEQRNVYGICIIDVKKTLKKNKNTLKRHWMKYVVDKLTKWFKPNEKTSAVKLMSYSVLYCAW